MNNHCPICNNDHGCDMLPPGTQIVNLTRGKQPSVNPRENVIADQDVHDPDSEGVRVLYRRGQLMPRSEAEALKIKFIELQDPDVNLETK